MTRMALVRVILTFAGLVLLGSAHAQQSRAPLLIEGKTALYQKVLTRPGATLTGSPGRGSLGAALPPFSILYVYERLSIQGGATLLAVGPDARGTIWGFVDAAKTVPWRHALVLAFTPRAGRDQVLFFRDRANLEGWLQRPDLSQAADRMRREAQAVGALGADSPIVSIEPQEYVDFSNPEQFYVLPVLEAKGIRLPSRQRVMSVRIASVTRNENTLPEQSAPSASRVQAPLVPYGGASLGGFRVGVAFVIDASSSMQPYIDETREVVHEVLGTIRAAGLIDGVRVGVVGYRDDPTKVRGIEYLSRTFVDPNSVTIDFRSALGLLQASQVSTRSFDEDAFAGINHAMSRIDWNGFDGRFLALITDASARDATSPYTTMGLNATEMRNDIQGASRALPTALFVLHLKTPEGRRDHARAAAQYTELSRMDTGRSLYYPVGLGDRTAFRHAIATLSTAIVEQILRVRGGAGAEAAFVPAPAAPAIGGELADTEGLRASVGEIGRAMALAYLGREAGTQAPDMFEAWASDRDFDDPSVAAFSVRVLLSKNQVSDLQKTMEATIEALNEAQTNPQDFFNQIQSASLAMGRDPNRVGQGPVRNLESSGLMGEYLEGLPYQSRLMAMSEDDWMRMGVTEQQAIIDDARSKIELYQRYHDDVHRWIPLHENVDRGDHVYPVPLDALP